MPLSDNRPAQKRIPMFGRLYGNARLLVFSAAVAFGLILLVFPPASLSTEESRAGALVTLAIGFWATGVIPEYLTSLIFFFCAMLFSISTPEVIFSGFGSTAFWLVFGGLVIGLAITDTGLGSRIAGRIVVHLDGSYLRLISGLVVMGMLFAFLMPSPIGRVLLLIPIALRISNYFGFGRESNGYKAVMLAVILGTVFPAFAILPANGVNMILAGLSETQCHIPILYGNYLFLNFPIIGLVKAVVMIVLIIAFYPDTPGKNENEKLTVSEPMSPQEVKLSIIIVLLLGLWMTDFLHKVSPAWISLGGAILLALPGIRIIDSRQLNGEVNYGSLFYMAGILGVGGLVNHSGLGDVLAHKIIDWLPFAAGRPFLNYMLLALASSITGTVTTLPGVPAVMTPISATLAQATALPLRTVIMTQVLGFSTIFLPYQIPSVVVGMQIAGEKLSVAAKICLILTAVTFIFLLPLNYYWWKLYGWL